MNRPVRVLVIDDSATMRAIIRTQLQADAGLEVVGEAADPLEAREQIKRLNPDVITLDVEMPGMNGLEFLDRLMRLRPMPVVMVSTLTQRGADAALAALELGAVECVGKPTKVGDSFGDLAGVVKAAAKARVRPADASPPGPQAPGYRPSGHVVAVGASTGGVEAILQVLKTFPQTCPPTVITQHMPANFTGSFAARLDKVCAPKVQEATDGAPLRTGHVYLAPGGLRHLEVAGKAGDYRCRLVAGDLVSGHRPSVDALFRSVAAVAGPAAVGVLLTGMGRDGAEGLLQMRAAGAVTLGQNEDTCVVYGMPRVAFEIGAVARQLSLSNIGPAALAAAAAAPLAGVR